MARLLPKKRLLSNKTFTTRPSLREVGLFIFEPQLKCLFAQRTIEPLISIDELEPFFSSREVSSLLNNREITPPLDKVS